jgi:hypothetical protein
VVSERYVRCTFAIGQSSKLLVQPWRRAGAWLTSTSPPSFGTLQLQFFHTFLRYAYAVLVLRSKPDTPSTESFYDLLLPIALPGPFEHPAELPNLFPCALKLRFRDISRENGIQEEGAPQGSQPPLAASSTSILMRTRSLSSVTAG